MSLLWSVFTTCATMLGLGVIAWYLGRTQMEARWARRHEAEAERNARLLLEREVAAERMRAAEEAARRKAMDRFLSDIHTEERAYLRRREVGASLTRSVVVEERLYLRNVPVSNWTQQELTFYTASGGLDVSTLLPR